MRKYLITVIILAVLLVTGFTIPSKLFTWEDRQRMDSLNVMESEEVVLVSQTNMTITEKIQLLGSSRATAVEMETGKNYTAEEMIVHAQKEAKILSELGILESENFYPAYGIERISFWIDARGGAKSMVLWSVYAESDGEKLRMLVDDETGKILTVTHTKTFMKVTSSNDMHVTPEKELSEYTANLEEVAEKWAQYWDVEIVETTVYDKTIISGYEEMQKEIELLIKNGLDAEEATEKIYEEWGPPTAEEEAVPTNRLYATFEDEGGIAMMGFRKNTGEIVFMIDIYI